MFLDEKGEKISKSKGNGLSLEEWLRYGTQESLAFYIYREPRRAKQLSFGVIPRAVDDYTISFSLLLNLVAAAGSADPEVVWGFVGKYLDKHYGGLTHHLNESLDQ